MKAILALAALSFGVNVWADTKPYEPYVQGVPHPASQVLPAQQTAQPPPPEYHPAPQPAAQPDIYQPSPRGSFTPDRGFYPDGDSSDDADRGGQGGWFPGPDRGSDRHPGHDTRQPGHRGGWNPFGPDDDDGQ